MKRTILLKYPILSIKNFDRSENNFVELSK